jgi:aspartyl-tRNA synthetase
MSYKGPIDKFIPEEMKGELAEMAGLSAGDTIFFIADKEDKANYYAGHIRTELGEKLDLIEKNAYRFCYVNDFPMFELDPETKKIGFTHNPFSMPQGGLEALNTMDPLEILAYQYDIVCNGVELSSGAVRNHDIEIMKDQVWSTVSGVPVRSTPSCGNGSRCGSYDHAASERG